MTAAELEALLANAPTMLAPSGAAIAAIIARDANGDADASAIVSGLVGAITIVAGHSNHTAHVLFAAINGLQRALVLALTMPPAPVPPTPTGELLS